WTDSRERSSCIPPPRPPSATTRALPAWRRRAWSRPTPGRRWCAGAA
ncbi:MAG: hypothetical protein AVDCRST_MAG06-2686, partial [uncultured Nocardioides sp.]